jgi:protein O-GlcNAc transferase
MTPLQQAISLHRAGNLDQAEHLYRQILAQEPHNPDALQFLGLLLDHRGQHEAAVQLIQQAIAINPTVAHYHNNLGEALRKCSRPQEAVAAFNQSISLRPDNPVTWYNLGLALAELKQFAEAVDAYHQAILHHRTFSEAYNNLAIALVALERKDEAIAAYKTAIEVAPTAPFSYVNLAMLLAHLGQYDEAIKLGQRAIKLNPTHAETHYNLGILLSDCGRIGEAIATYLKATELDPRHALAHNNAGNWFREIGEPDRALNLIRRSLEIHFDPKLYINVVSTLYYSPSTHPAIVRQEHERWTELTAPALTLYSDWPNDRSPDRRLRIGYVSPDFREHSVAYFLEPILANHVPRQVEVFCYSDVKEPDDFTARLKSLAHTWRDVVHLSHEQLAEQVRSDGIDILIDLAGQTTGSRLPAFALKPAPVQITYLGYPNTTGVKQIDYKITDPIADPDGTTDSFYTERLLRLPRTFLCYRVPTTLPAISPLPALTSNTITFACFNPISKINPEVAELWSRVLEAVPNSRLLIKSHLLHDSATRELVTQRLISNNIPRERLELQGRTKTHQEHIALYNTVDIALDPFPYNGTTTTCEALAMGIPVITLAGTSHISRVGVSLLTNVGLPQLIAQSGDEYVRITKDLAANLPNLANLRSSLRDRLKKSILCDEPRFTRDLENACRLAWTSWTNQL